MPGGRGADRNGPLRCPGGMVFTMGNVRYAGQDCRHHKVFITKHTEYHVRSNIVVAVRPRARKIGSVATRRWP